MSVEFMDTNILVYAWDLSAGSKRKTSRELLERLILERTGRISVQVLMEFYVTTTRKANPCLTIEQAVDVVDKLLSWNPYAPKGIDVLEAVRIAARYQINFWDAMIVRAAAAEQARILWTEDLNHGQEYEGVMVNNPFLA